MAAPGPNLTLKRQPPHLPPCDPKTRSDVLHPSSVPANADPRAFYLRPENTASVPAPLISISPFVPRALVHLLMRGKKNSALGVKWRPGDRITNMEGAMHTFITPVIARCEFVGDYRFAGGHGIVDFGTADDRGKSVRQTRCVVMSAAIQPDFENKDVMLRVCRLDGTEVLGVDLLRGGDAWESCALEDKQNAAQRAAYDESLRRHIVYHLTRSHRLPPRAPPVGNTIAFLESVINSPALVDEQFVGIFSETPSGQVVSLELLFNAAVQQARNEFSALEVLCGQGYVYTYDPASIFASEIDARVLNRLMLCAVKSLAAGSVFSNMRTFAVNDYADKNFVALVQAALRNQHVSVKSKADLFKGAAGTYKAEGREEGAMLVAHNNSDGFGQNIETEHMGGSLDGAVGASSSAAASLERTRGDLLDFIF